MAKMTVAELAIDVGRHEERIKDCEDYRDKQNGSLRALDKKFDRMIYLHFAELVSVVGVAWYIRGCIR